MKISSLRPLYSVLKVKSTFDLCVEYCRTWRLLIILEARNGNIENIDGFAVRGGRDCADRMGNEDKAAIGKRSEGGEVMQHA
jgi:hypothetical protein